MKVNKKYATRFHPENVIPDALLFLEETHNNEAVPKHPAGVLKDSPVKRTLFKEEAGEDHWKKRKMRNSLPE